MKTKTSTLKSATILKKLTSSKAIAALFFFIIGAASTVWFLLRVIPKPSRAGYPCMKAAAPVMSGFVVYALAITGSMVAFKKFSNKWASAKYLTAATFFAVAIIMVVIAQTGSEKELQASDLVSQSHFMANEPIGTAKGFKPGRVVWVWDKDATNQDFTPANSLERWWAKQTDAKVVDKMLANSIFAYTNRNTIKEGWNDLFKYFNIQHGKGEVGYKKGEKIYIKVNLTNSDQSGAISGTKKTGNYDRMDATPEVMLALLKQLIEEVGIAQEDIYMGDPFRSFHDLYWEVCHSVYPNVVYCDGKGKNGRHKTIPTDDQYIFFSDRKNAYRIPQEYVDSEYFINLACLKTHDSGGITLGAKNHQGSILQDGAGSESQSAFDMHYALPDNDAENNGHHRYRHLVDYLAHKQLGGKTLITIIDGIWAGRSWQGYVEKWTSAPFGNDYPNSLLISQDIVAIDAVGYDFLLEEYKNKANKEKYCYMEGTDDFLYQAADPAAYGDGINYDPEDDGNPVGSLGVFEHWNNATDKKYSRNLGTGNGIELVAVTPANYLNSVPVTSAESSISLVIFPNQVADQLNIRWNLTTKGIVSTEILTLDGRKIAEQTPKPYQVGKHQQTLNVRELAKGMYLLKLNVEQEKSTHTTTQKFQKK